MRVCIQYLTEVSIPLTFVHNNFIKYKISEKTHIFLGNKEKWISVGLNLVKKNDIALCILL